MIAADRLIRNGRVLATAGSIALIVAMAALWIAAIGWLVLWWDLMEHGPHI